MVIKSNKNFISVILTVLVCAFSLVLFSGLSTAIFLNNTGNKTATPSDLVAYFGKNMYFLLQLLPFTVVLCTLFLCIRFIHKEKLTEIISWRGKFDSKRFFFSFILWFATLCCILGFELILGNNDIRFQLKEDFWLLVLISLVFVSLQTAFEEVFFRAYLMRFVFESKNQAWIPIFSSSILFALLHANNPEIELMGESILFYFFGTGIFLALMTYLDKGIELAWGFHTANNLFASLILTNNWQVFQTDALLKDFSPPEIPWTTWLNLFVLFPTLIFSFSKVYKWDFGVIFARFVKKSKHD